MADEATVVDPMERIADSLSGIGETIAVRVSESMESSQAELRALLDERLPRVPVGDEAEDEEFPGERARRESSEEERRIRPQGAGLNVRVRDEFDQMWRDDRLSESRNAQQMRANFELARVMMGFGGRIAGTSQIEPSDRFMEAFRHYVDEGPRTNPDRYGAPVRVHTGSGRMRAYDTAESGAGLELIGTAYESEMWMASRNRDPLLQLIREIPVTENSQVVPIDGALPEMLLAAESTTAGASAYGDSTAASSKVTQSPKKFTIQNIWSGEIGEDSIVPWVPFLREQLTESFRLHLASAYYNGDTTATSTGNINKDDGSPTATKHYLAWDGIRHQWLVTTATQGADASGPINLELITEARGRLNAAGNDIDAGVSNIDWSAEVSDLLLVCDRDTYYSMVHSLDDIVTVERYGQGATIITGELARLGGMRVISPSYASKTEADGKASDTASNNTKGQITIVNTRGCLGGVRRGVEFYADRIQRTDQLLLEMYTRRSFNVWASTVTAGIYNITV